MIDFDNNFQLVNDYLERNGPINSYERLMDNIEIIPIRKEEIIEREKIEAEKKKKEEEEIENDANFNLKEDENKKKDNLEEEFRFTKEKLVLPKIYKEIKEHSIDDEFDTSKNLSKQSSIKILKDEKNKIQLKAKVKLKVKAKIIVKRVIVKIKKKERRKKKIKMKKIMS